PADNASEAVNATLAFPDVTDVAVYNTAGRALISRSKSGAAAPALALQDTPPAEATLEAETDASWRFIAPVRTKTETTPFDVVQRPDELLGYVRVVQSKATLTRMIRNVFLVNLAISFFFAGVFLLAIRFLGSRLTRPLTAFMGYAQILKMHAGLTDRQLVGLNTIENSGEHLLMLIIDILDLSKIEAGKTELYPAAVDPRIFLRGIGDIIRIKAEEKNLAFVLDVEPDLPRGVAVDEKRLRQVLLNLLGNAVKFTDRGWVRLGVQRLRAEDGQTR